MPPPTIGLTAQQRIDLQERKIWLAAHKAPEGLALISDQEMKTIVHGVATEAHGRRVATAGLALANQMIEQQNHVVDHAEQAVQQMDALVLAGADPMTADQLVSLRCSLSNLRKWMAEHAEKRVDFPGR